MPTTHQAHDAISSAPLLAESKLYCSVGVMAYNEEANIGQLLRALLDQHTSTCVIQEVLIIASGCTDNTESIVRTFADQDSRVKLLTQSRREGKASAVNLFLHHASTDILVMAGADTIPSPNSIQKLVEPFAEPEVGMTGGHPIPINDPATFMGFAAHLLWELHHQVALKNPKLGELTAFRRVFQRIPITSAVDEASIQPLMFGQGYQLRYVPDAIVHNCGPKTISDFLRQRRRIHAGHLRIHKRQGYRVSTMSSLNIMAALGRAWQWNWRFVLWTPAVIALEIMGRLLGWMDYRLGKRDHAVWEIATTTKERIA